MEGKVVFIEEEDEDINNVCLHIKLNLTFQSEHPLCVCVFLRECVHSSVFLRINVSNPVCFLPPAIKPRHTHCGFIDTFVQ